MSTGVSYSIAKRLVSFLHPAFSTKEKDEAETAIFVTYALLL